MIRMTVHGLPSELLDERELRLRYRQIDAAVIRAKHDIQKKLAERSPQRVKAEFSKAILVENAQF